MKKLSQVDFSNINPKNGGLPLVFNVVDSAYGAVADGVTDDGPAIQLAVNAANTAGGGTVFFPKGTYAIKTEITVYPNITYAGVKHASVLDASSFGHASGTRAVMKSTNTAGKTDFYFKDLA